MTPQAEILTKMIGRTKPDGEVVPNPIFGASEKELEVRYEEAKAVYADVFKQFISAWWAIGDRTNPPPLRWEHFAL